MVRNTFAFINVYFVILLTLIIEAKNEEGFLLYCPCMGRFGNQADQFLGSLAFAKGTGRTLVLPPWIMYNSFSSKVNFLSFDSLFNVTLLEKYHKVTTMEEFMKNQADHVWPRGERTSFCYTARQGKLENSCNSKDGSPFGPFWNHFNVDFLNSQMYAPLTFHTSTSSLLDWRTTYSFSHFPVIAMTGAPAGFPVSADHVSLHQYLVWTDEWKEKGDKWVKSNLPEGKWLGIHLRNGQDWVRACDHTESTNNLFSSPQCLGYKNEFGSLDRSLCFPDTETILESVAEKVKLFNAQAVFIAADNDHMIRQFQKYFSDNNVDISFHKLDFNDSLLDLVILAQSDHFIGNCVSSFSAFVKRERDVNGLSSSFWSYSTVKDEL